MVPKRWAKRAVTRNSIKRQIYNVSASIENSLLERAHVVRLRAGFDPSGFRSANSTLLKVAVRQELIALFDAAQSGAEKIPERTRSTRSLA
jgi:ribonuclease P protein component